MHFIPEWRCAVRNLGLSLTVGRAVPATGPTNAQSAASPPLLPAAAEAVSSAPRNRFVRLVQTSIKLGLARLKARGAKIIAVNPVRTGYAAIADEFVTLASATGLTAFGTARPLDRPHFTENYILREMGYQVARKHAVKLRRIAVGLAFFVPALLALLAAFGIAPALTAPAAALIALAGLLVERWLFFAEATHVATVYYGR